METTATVLSCEKVAVETFKMVLRTEAAKDPIRPGRFIHIKVPNHPEMILRRPISIHAADPGAQTLELIIQRKGEGTHAIVAAKPGDVLDIVGPLGNGFTIPEGARRAAVIGGGLGVAPLYTILQSKGDCKVESFLGFRGAEYAYAVDDFAALSDAMHLVSDDGSLGEKGFATDKLDAALSKEPFDAVFACGPMPMFKSLSKVMEKYPDVPCFISLEERMGCGVGACYTCICKIKSADGDRHLRVCVDGPVFNIREVEL